MTSQSIFPVKIRDRSANSINVGSTIVPDPPLIRGWRGTFEVDFYEIDDECSCGGRDVFHWIGSNWAGQWQLNLYRFEHLL